VYVATMEASTVVRVGSASSMNTAFVFAPCAGSEHSCKDDISSGWRVNPSARTYGRIVGLDLCNQLRSARRNVDSSVRWSGWSEVAITAVRAGVVVVGGGTM
jgi:hypothetical protein